MRPRSTSLVEVGVDHTRAGQEVLGRVCRAADERGGPAGLPGCAGIVVLRTCHRVELYLEGVGGPAAVELYRQWLGDAAEGAGPIPVAVRSGRAAARHLLRVIAGLESAVLGEDQILGQVRAAYRRACELGTSTRELHALFHAAFRCGKRVRSETAIAAGGRSLAGAAVGFLQEELGGLTGRTVLVLGAGEMGGLAAKRLAKRGAGQLLIANRTWSKAQAVAAAVGGNAVPWQWRAAALESVRGVVCATGARAPVILASDLMAAARGRSAPLVVADLAVPANVESLERPSALVTVATVEDLRRRLAIHAERRLAAVAGAEGIIEEELAGWQVRLGPRTPARERAG